MEHRHANGVRSGRTRESAHRSRILTSTSGKPQTHAADTKSHLDFRRSSSNGNRAVSEPQYHSSVPILRSSLPQRRLHDRPYLYNPKYLNYLERKRYDTGEDGKPVWPDHIEESFQNALVHIPPMGRHKKTQYGRPHGRNQLIREWILQETGEERSRKQVSSHIQFLSNLLKGDPDWRALTIADENTDHVDNASEFYFESIADEVRLQRQMTTQAKMESCDGQSWLGLLSRRHSLGKISFDMWVGLPENYTKALHNYSRLQNSQCTTPSAPLENFKDWRGKFPDLDPILRSSADEQFDIVVVKSRFSLMPDFPPPASKLVHILCLDFRNPAKDNLRALDELKLWSYVNHMYMHGQPLQKKEYKQCQIDDVGVVPLGFEAGWWASQFTNLTQKRKEAEDTKDEIALADAEDYSKSLLRSLTIMQEVHASPHAEGPKKRMAILLWVFSLASKGHTGITSWQKVVPPPHRKSTNSPSSDNFESLPPLIMDSMISSSFDTDMIDHDFLHPDTEGTIPISPTMYETGAYHSGFTPLNTMSGDSLRLFDFVGSTGFTPNQPTFVDMKCEPFNFAAPIQPVPSFSSLQQTMVSHKTVPATFQLLSNYNIAAPKTYHIPHQLEMSSPGLARRHSLANFDMSAHHMLQAQLGPDMGDIHETQNIEVDEAGHYKHSTPTPAEIGPLDPEVGMPFDSQQNMIGHLNHLELDTQEEQMSQAVMADLEENGTTDHPIVFDSPRTIRPPLMAHHSFAGVLHNHSGCTPSRLNKLDTLSEHDCEQLAFDTPERNDFARFINNHTQYESPGDLFCDHHPTIDQMAFPGVDFGTSIGRLRSQPTPPSNDENMLPYDTPMQQQHWKAKPDLKVEQL